MHYEKYQLDGNYYIEFYNTPLNKFIMFLMANEIDFISYSKYKNSYRVEITEVDYVRTLQQFN